RISISDPLPEAMKIALRIDLRFRFARRASVRENRAKWSASVIRLLGHESRLSRQGGLQYRCPAAATTVPVPPAAWLWRGARYRIPAQSGNAQWEAPLLGASPGAISSHGPLYLA